MHPAAIMLLIDVRVFVGLVLLLCVNFTPIIGRSVFDDSERQNENKQNNEFELVRKEKYQLEMVEHSRVNNTTLDFYSPHLVVRNVHNVLLDTETDARSDTVGDIKGGGSLLRKRRYTGILSRRFKLNRRYQECVGPDEVQGHCKHVVYCPMDVVGISGKASLDYLCIIEKMHVGVCCPDDILLRSLTGAQVIMDLPASGDEYDDTDANTGCGLTSLARPSDGQRNIPAKRWPWLAALYKPEDQKQQFCGGALITDIHILTAAHCFTGLRREDIRVRLGEYDFRKADETRSRDFTIASIANHEEFNQATYENDIAILTLDRSAPFNSYMWPICLPPMNRSYENEMVTVAGWGQQYYAGPTSNVLLEVTMPVWPQKKCVDSFAQRISDRNLCAAGLEGGKDSCLGDSGGPLVYQLENGRWVAVGLVSWGIGCGNKDQPGIYTRVDKFIPWIIRNTIVK